MLLKSAVNQATDGADIPAMVKARAAELLIRYFGRIEIIFSP